MKLPCESGILPRLFAAEKPLPQCPHFKMRMVDVKITNLLFSKQTIRKPLNLPGQYGFHHGFIVTILSVMDPFSALGALMKVVFDVWVEKDASQPP